MLEERQPEAQIAELLQVIAQLQQEIEQRDRQLEAYASQKPVDFASEAALQKALLQSEYQSMLLHAVIDSSPDWIFIKDEQSRYILVNQSYAQQMGRPVEAIIGYNDLELFSEELVLGNAGKGIRGFRIDDKAVLAGETVHNPYDVITVAEGEERIFDTHKFPLRGAEGEIFGVIGVSRDITDRHTIAAALADSEKKFRSLVESSQDQIWVMDADGIYTFVNPASRVVLGYEPEELIGRHFTDFQTPEQAALDFQEFRRILEVGSVFQYETTMIGKGNQIVHILVSAMAMFDDQNNLLGMTGTASNISDRKQAELAIQRSEAQLREQTQQLEKTLAELQSAQAHLVQSEKMSSLGQLVAGVAHEINNPVNFIYGNLNYAHDYIQDLLKLVSLYQKHYPQPAPEIQTEIDTIDLDFLTTDLPKLLTSMKIGADRIQQIVLSLRNFSRMDEAEFKPVNLHDGIDSTLMILQNRIKPRPEHPGIVIRRNYGELPTVECYAGQLNQVFMNILSNAIDALEERDSKRSIQDINQAPSTITIHTAVMDANRVSIQISDNGGGIPESVRQRIFDPFFTTKPVGKGTGMGLAISYQVVTEKHGGSLTCSSTAEGTVFVIEIPMLLTPVTCHPDDPAHTPHSPYKLESLC